MKPKWTKAERFERVGRFTLSGTPKQVFPLLCPVLEYEWLPRWRCTMRFSESGVAEKDAVFSTTETHGMTAMWTTITYEPDTFIEYLIVNGRNAVVRLSISLESTGERQTAVLWRMLLTATSALGKRALRAHWTEATFQEMMRERNEQLEFFLTHGRMMGT